MKIFLDSSDLEAIKEFEPKVDGFTTNPTLMRKAGVTDYEKFCKDALALTKKPISFEVFADEFDEMERQARIISSWGENVNVKIPITNTKGESATQLIHRLHKEGIKLNVTAILTLEQVEEVKRVLIFDTPAIISVFAGRIADTGRDPVPHMAKAKEIIQGRAELLWASPREVLNIYQAQGIADIVTCLPDLIAKYEKLKGKDLEEYSLETVQMFYNDAKASGYTL